MPERDRRPTLDAPSRLGAIAPWLCAIAVAVSLLLVVAGALTTP